MDIPSTGARLRIQTVLFEHSLEQLWRLLRGLDAASRQALDRGLASQVEWALGDSSPAPMLGATDAETMASASSSAISSVSYEYFGANLGSSGGQNRLALGQSADLILVLNPDTYPSPTALVELIRAVVASDVGIAEARQIPLTHPRHYDPKTGETSWASGFCMMVRRQCFESIGGFDANHFLLHCDDVDFSWRARKTGAKVVTAPAAVVFHDKRPRPGVAWPAPDHEIFYATLGRLLLATRWGRKDIVDQTSSAIEASGSKIQRDALAEFRRRVTSGAVPAEEPDAAQVAQFIDGEYAVHNF